MTEINISKQASLRRVTAAASIGSAFEWYDFFLSSSIAALVWPFVFFEYLPTALAAALSVITFGVTFLTRPIGAYIFGHIGDRVGRKSTLILTLVIMGAGTFGIGLTPGYSSIGLTAPILLIIWRMIFGIGIGGEYGGAISWVLEYSAKLKWRSVWLGVVQATSPIGIATAAGTISFLTYYYSHEAFLLYAWRIPFIVAGIALILGIIFRYLTKESIMFEEVKKQNKIEKYPASRVLREYPKETILVALAVFLGVGIPAIVLQPFSVSYLVDKGISPSLTTLAVAIGGVAAIISNMLGSVLAQIMGRRLTYIVAILSGIIFTFPFFLLISTLNVLFIYLSFIIMLFINEMGFGVLASIGPEQFPTRLRYSGTGFSYQLGTFFVGLVLLLVVPYFESRFGVVNAWPYVAIFMIVLLFISLFSVLKLRETKNKTLE
jgi:MFS family permease